MLFLRLHIFRWGWLILLGCAIPTALFACQPAPTQAVVALAGTAVPYQPSPTHDLSQTPAPSDPQIYTNPELGFKVTLPAGWQPAGKDHFKSEEGEMLIQPLQEDGAGLAHACTLEANQHPGNYGDPQIQIGTHGSLVGCMILTSLNNNITGRTGFLIQYPPASAQKGYLLLRVDPAHFDRIAASFAFIPSSTPAPTPAAAPTFDPSPPVANITPTASTFSGLSLVEYPVVPAAEDTPTHFEFKHRIPAWVFEKNQALRNPDTAALIKENNARLASLGVRLELKPSSQEGPPQINLVRDAQVKEENIQNVWPASTNQSGTDFAMLVENQQGQFLVQKDSFEPWDSLAHSFTQPVFVGDDLITLESSAQRDRVLVKKGGQDLYALSVSQGVDNPVKGIFAYDHHWILEVSGLLVIDGEVQNEKLGYQEIFGWSLRNGQPFYFFRKDGKIGMSYQGQPLPTQFDDVIHDRCCEPAAFNPGSSPNLVWFYALKNGIWEYVELGPGG
jgi:hypothetical protein